MTRNEAAHLFFEKHPHALPTVDWWWAWVGFKHQLHADGFITADQASTWFPPDALRGPKTEHLWMDKVRHQERVAVDRAEQDAWYATHKHKIRRNEARRERRLEAFEDAMFGKDNS